MKIRKEHFKKIYPNKKAPQLQGFFFISKKINQTCNRIRC
jgi:hypothetical protein